MLILPIDFVDLTDKIVVLRQNCVIPGAPLAARVRRVKGGNGVIYTKDPWLNQTVYVSGPLGTQTHYQRKDIQGWISEEDGEKFLMWNALKNVN